jgi:zinc resistance-associated protein
MVMKKIMMISLAVLMGLFLSNAVYAWWGGHGMGYGAGANVETMKKFQKETLSLRDELMTKEIELQNEYNKPVPDTNRIGTLRKEIIDIQTKIQTIADKYGLATSGYMGGMMGYGQMGRGMMGGGMMMDMCPMGWW